MNRRSFIRNAGLAAAGAVSLPYILPSGRLFAASGSRKVNHVVFLLFAGGVRNLESVQFNDGNLMPNLLSGGGTISPDILPAMDFLPPGPLTQSLQQYGTLFRNFRYKEGPTGHYNGHTVAVTGQYVGTDLNIREAPRNPTIFEYYRKHNSPQQTALNSWWIANSLGPYPALNYSTDPDYGVRYGANFMSPNFLINPDGATLLGNSTSFSSAEQAAINAIRKFSNGSFNQSFVDPNAGIMNTPADTARLQNFISNLYTKLQNGAYNNPWGVGSAMNGDMYNILFAEEVISEFKPELLVVNMQDVDIGHFNFSQYANNLRKADFAAAHLWNHIQNTPGMANDTVMIVMPEHGRNFNPNTSADAYGRLALDHTAPVDTVSGDQMAREIFCMVVGPPSVVKQGLVINAVEGESIDVVPAIANLLGFDTGIPLSAGIKNYNQCDIAQAFY
jgi:hypothetical protein